MPFTGSVGNLQCISKFHRQKLHCNQSDPATGLSITIKKKSLDDILYQISHLHACYKNLVCFLTVDNF